MEPGNAAEEAGPRIDEHFDHIRANLIQCEECNENFFFDFLRHPRYFVTHFKTCHLKNVLYRFNGCSEEENQRVRFGPRRKKDAKAWFGQLKSTEKRMISMQDNKWGEIAERECWSCRLCKQARKSSEIPHAFEPNELGRRQALLHLRQFHETTYNQFLSMLPAVDSSASRAALASHRSGNQMSSSSPVGYLGLQTGALAIRSVNQSSANGTTTSTTPRQSVEAERSRLRRMRATPEAKKAEAERSRRRREQLTPAQRQADTKRRARKRLRAEERERSRLRRTEASPDARQRETKRSRERRQNATEQQRKREAQRSRMRRQNATEEQRVRERERCRRRYEIQKQQRLMQQQSTPVASLAATPVTPVSDATSPPASVASDQSTPPRRRVLPTDLERRNQQLLQQQAGLGLQLRSLYASLSLPSSQIDL
ncbi:hypothetical protein GN244_ATG04459 [Phytophthora infestans]|uniref:Uncharacterized protein n=1 Tax=Phytophthora infestans TaxID=4787 RepID=A0A833W5P3_PHYIN|nr:hypothetical protein GN244_ATG04459 [Phytophthora infestans]